MIGAIVAAAIAIAAGPAAAKHERSRSSRAGGESEADAAVAEVRERTGGRILDVRLVERDGRREWRIKVLLPGGRVRVYFVEAAKR